MDILAALSLFITLHQVDGRKMLVNPRFVIQLAEARGDNDPAKQLIDGVNCVVIFTTGKYLSVVETCAEVRRLIEDMTPPAKEE